MRAYGEDFIYGAGFFVSLRQLRYLWPLIAWWETRWLVEEECGRGSSYVYMGLHSARYFFCFDQQRLRLVGARIRVTNSVFISYGFSVRIY